ncbi:ATP synthase F1 subunit delta [Candidatus Sumerlaeota bacterium]|nr:ATP synthase F1 subunit delta [Candidatus Sumerlaeota bacterium]
MILDPEVAERYGDALFAVAKRRNELDAIWQDAEELMALVPRGSQIRTFLEGPQFNTADQERVVEKVFKGQLHELLTNLLHLLIHRRRIYYLEAILETFQRLVEESRGIYPAEVVSAVELNEAQKRDVEACMERYTQTDLRIHWRVEENLIGGLVVKFKDLLIDDSVSTRFAKLKHDMMAVRV